MIRAVIFDMDGVLVDTEPIYLSILKSTMLELGYKLSDEQLKQYAGSNISFKAQDIVQKFRTPFDASFIRERYTDHFPAQLNYEALMFPDVPGCMRELKDLGLQIGIASNSNRDKLHTILKQCDISQYIDYVVGCDDVPARKPAPDVYRYVMSRLNLTPAVCMAVEDSTYGISASVAAGIYTIAKKDDRFAFDTREASCIITSLREIAGIVKLKNTVCGGGKA